MQQSRLCFCIYYSVENAGPNLSGGPAPINPHLQRALPPNPSYFISGSIDTRIIAYSLGPTIDLCIVDVTN